MTSNWIEDLVPPDGTVNQHLGVRFDASGRFLPEAGNTVVAHVVPGSVTERALIWLRGEMTTLSQAHRFAFTEIASYHMTVFEGVTTTRRAPDVWPAAVSLQSTINEATEAMSAMLEAFEAPPDFSIRPVDVTPNGLILAGATPRDDATAREWRDRLALAWGFRKPDHDNYFFHATMAYARSWLPVAALTEYETAMQRLTAQFVAKVPVMDLQRPAFCRFSDINSFPPLRLL